MEREQLKAGGWRWIAGGRWLATATGNTQLATLNWQHLGAWMFALHETTQRRFCRATFLIVCVLPTMLTLAGIAYCHRPWREDDWQRALSHQFHVRASLDDVAHPRPGSTALKNVRLGDLRTGRSLGVLGDLRYSRGNGRLSLYADRLQIDAAQLPAFATVAATCLATQEWESFAFQADRLTITHGALPAVHFDDLVVSGDQDAAGEMRTLVQAHYAGQPVKIVLLSQDGSLRSSLRAPRTPLPAWLIGKLVPGIGGCGDAMFYGEIQVDQTQQGLHGAMRGRLEGVDLQQWIGAASPYRLEGICEVQIDQLMWSDAKIEMAEGKIDSAAGAASDSLLGALISPQLSLCRAGSGWNQIQPSSSEELIFFDRLSVSFRLSSAGLSFAGECPGGALATARGAALLFGSSKQKEHPVAHLVRLFHFPQQGWLPDTLGAHQMSSGLPLPAGRAPATEPASK